MARDSLRTAIAAAVAVLLLAACGSSGSSADQPDDQPTETQASAAGAGGDASLTPEDAGEDDSTIVVTVKNGRVITEDELVELKVGDPVTIEITSDVADEVHVHGYERKAEVKPGKTVVIKFNADIPGTFEVEFEEAGLKLFELQVR